VGSKLLVTGAGGLIGSHTIRLLRKLDPPVVTFRSVFPDGNLLQPGALEECLRVVRPSHVLHMAWSASGTADYREDPSNYDWARCTFSLASMCVNQEVTFWGMGSVAELDTDARDPYTAAKGSVWHALRAAVRRGEIGWFRPHYVFDPVRRSPSLLRELARAREEGRSAHVHSPEMAHDFVHAKDVASAIQFAIDASMLGLIEIGSGRTRSVRDVCKAFGVDVAASRAMSSSIDSVPCADTNRLRSVGWSPESTENFFREGFLPLAKLQGA
jgi:nucleoside-diphosphate-sugar epimerase